MQATTPDAAPFSLDELRARIRGRVLDADDVASAVRFAVQVLEIEGGRIGGITFLLDTARFFPLFGLPARLDP